MAQVLVIDDEALIRAMLQDALSLAGHEIALAENGRKAVRLLREQAFDLIITDIFMPEKDGLETIAAIRRACPQARIIAISGGSRIRGADVLDWAAKAGADVTLQKPVEEAELLHAIDRCLALSSAGSAARSARGSAGGSAG